MNRNRIVFGACCVAFVSSMLACNLPAGSVTESTAEPIPPTTSAVPPLPTGTPTPEKVPDPTSTPVQIEHAFPSTESPAGIFDYLTRPGDTLEALARRFGVEPAQIPTDSPLPTIGYLPVGQQLQIPNLLGAMSPGGDLLPDGELV